jgi:hypothetical protein
MGDVKSKVSTEIRFVLRKLNVRVIANSVLCCRTFTSFSVGVSKKRIEMARL